MSVVIDTGIVRGCYEMFVFVFVNMYVSMYGTVCACVILSQVLVVWLRYDEKNHSSRSRLQLLGAYVFFSY